MTLNPALLSSKNMAWETPDEVLSLVRQLGPIGLDPATSPENPVGALAYYTPTEDGLAQDWTGKGLVFCNPPYGRALIHWVKKASIEAAKGAEVILLVPSRTDTKWFQDWALATSQAVCLWRGRITFVGSNDPAPFPSAIFYWGPRVASFEAVFCAEGTVLKR